MLELLGCSAARLLGCSAARLLGHRPSPIAHRPSPIAHRPSPVARRPSPVASMRLLLTLLISFPVSAQVGVIADSASVARRAEQWETLGRLAQKGIAASSTPEDRCRFLLAGVLAQTRLWRFASAPARLRAFDAQCGTSTVASSEATMLADIRRELTLPPMPIGPADWTAVDQFWMMVDTLSLGVDPTRAQWRSLMATPGYRIAMISHGEIQRQIDIAFRRPRRAERDSLLGRRTEDLATISHLLDVAAARAELVRFRATLEPVIADIIAAAVKNASRFLPPGAADHAVPPLVTMTFIASDGYSQQPGIVLDLEHVRETGLTDLPSHEFHHSLRSLRNEGIADMIDKPHPLTGPPGMQWYVTARPLRMPQPIRRARFFHITRIRTAHSWRERFSRRSGRTP
jgi:hypothetical protein